jgi:hypothetical protein
MRIKDLRFDAFSQPGQALAPRSWMRSLACLAVLVAIPYIAGVSQTGTNASGNPVHNYSGVPPLNPLLNPIPDANKFLESSMRAQNSQKQIDELNLLRQKEMTSDTQKLVVLAIQLKAETDSTSKQKLSMLTVRQAELIEKLARGVRNKMKATVDEGPAPIENRQIAR